MTDSSGPWSTNPWTDQQWHTYAGAAMPAGVLGSPAASYNTGSLGFQSTGLDITLAAGDAVVAGAGYSRTAPTSATTATANTHSTFSRRDRIVARRDTATQSTTLVIIVGTPGATPAPPAITRSATVYDLPLFSFLVPPASGTALAGVVDERLWLPTPGALPTVVNMAGRPTVNGGAVEGLSIYDATTNAAYTYDGRYWRDATSANALPTGTPDGAYIFTQAGSAVTSTIAAGIANVTMPRDFAVPTSLVQLTVGDTNSNLYMVAHRSGASTTSVLSVSCRDNNGVAIPNSTTVRINWQAIGYSA